MKTRTTALAAAAFIAFAPVTAYAATTTDPLATEEIGDGEQEDGDKGLWGLLGLLGLFAPLFNKKRDNDVHVHRTTTTGTHGRNDGNPLT